MDGEEVRALVLDHPRRLPMTLPGIVGDEARQQGEHHRDRGEVGRYQAEAEAQDGGPRPGQIGKCDEEPRSHGEYAREGGEDQPDRQVEP